MKKFTSFVAILFSASLAFTQQGTPQSQAVTQTRSGTQVSGSGTAPAVGASTTTGTAAPAAGSTATDTSLTAVPTQTETSGSLVGTNATGSDLPLLQNNTNLFGRIVGTTTNLPATGSGLNSGQASALGTPGTVAQQTAQGVGAPGFTQVSITLQGTVQSEGDRQAILNRFVGLPGFTVIDQLQIAGQNGQTVNEAAGAEAVPTRP